MLNFHLPEAGAKAITKASRDPTPAGAYTVDELLLMRAQIDEMLPATALKDLDLRSELVQQFMQIKALQARVMEDGKVPPNQAAQVANSCAATLAQLTKVQSDLYSTERMKEIEQILIRTLRKYPELAESFMVDYEAELQQGGEERAG